MSFNAGDVVAATYEPAIAGDQPIPFQGAVVLANQTDDRYHVQTPFGFAAVYSGAALTLVSSGGASS